MNLRKDSTTRAPRPSPLEHVFVATDFSAGAAHALARAGRLPVAKRGKITVIHVLPDRIPQTLRADAETLARRQLEAATKILVKAAAALDRRDIRVSSVLCQGLAYVEIIRHARSLAADLIVLGRHGRRPLRDMFIGSTAERVIRAGDLPVLVVGRRPGGQYRRPLIAVDLEDTCRRVVAEAMRVVGPGAASATLVHAYHVPFEGFITPAATRGEMTDLRKEFGQTAASGLERVQASLGDLGVRWQTVLVRGDPRQALLAEATRRRADLLAVGTHGRSGISHVLLGSVAEWIVQAAPCDVLVARPARVSFELP